MTKLRLAGMGTLLTLALGLGAACGTDKKDEEENQSTATLKWADISPIVVASCTGSQCHGKTDYYLNTLKYSYEDSEARFKAALNMDTKLSTDDMPRAPKNGTLSAADEQKLIDFWKQ